MVDGENQILELLWSPHTCGMHAHTHEVLQRGRALAALERTWIHFSAPPWPLTTTRNLTFIGSDTLFWSPRALYVYHAHIYMQANTHKIKKSKSQKRDPFHWNVILCWTSAMHLCSDGLHHSSARSKVPTETSSHKKASLNNVLLWNQDSWSLLIDSLPWESWYK